eukprot:Hpha_TRINITY_DN11944_c0_g1::TRINITY_DN11944_c0_g1_i2::g.20514::m.20514
MGQGISRQTLIDSINRSVATACNPGLKPGKRVAALRRLEEICHVQKERIGVKSQQILAEVHHLARLLEVTGSNNKSVVRAAWSVLVAVTSTSDKDIKVSVGRRVLEDVMEELLDRSLLHASDLRPILRLVANLSTEDPCRMQLHKGVTDGREQRGGVTELVQLLNHNDAWVQLAALEALVGLSEKRVIRIQIVQCEGLLAVTGLAFVSTLYGQIRQSALRLLANLSKEHDVRCRMSEQAVLYRLAHACKKAHGTYPRSLLLLVASVFCNFSNHDDFSGVPREDAIAMLYQLAFSDELDYVVQGVWGMANYLTDFTMRREFIETDGVKLLFSVLGESGNETQIWFEVARTILSVASGGLNRAPASQMEADAIEAGIKAVQTSGALAGAEGTRTGTEEEKEFLIREGALEALVAIYAWCMGESGSKKKTEVLTGPQELDELPPEEQGAVYDDQGEDIERSARYLCMTVVTHALQHLTTFGFVCQMLCDLGATKAVMKVLRADFDTEGQEHAAAVVGNLARHAEPCRVVVMEDDVVGTLVDLLKFSTHELVHLQASYALANIARMSGHYQKVIIESGGVVGLVAVLKQQCPEVTAKNCIHALSMLSTNEAKFEVMQAGGLLHILRYAASAEDDLRLSCANALRNLSEMSNDAHHLAMVRDGALGVLVRMLEENNKEINKQSAQALATLTARMESNKVALVEQDGLRAVARHLAADDDDLLIYVLSVLGNLGTVSGIMAEMSKLGMIVRQLCYVLQMDKFPLTLQAMRCLTNVTADEEDSAIILSLVPAQVFIGMLESSNATLQRHAAHVVANLAMFPANWPHLRKCNIIKILTKQMRSDNFDVVIQSVRCLAYLMQDSECEAEMEKYSMVMVLAEVARKSIVVLDEQQDEEGVRSYIAARNLKMQEQVMTAMRLLSKKYRDAMAIVERYGCLEVFLRLLEVPSIDVRRETAGCLANLTSFVPTCEKVVEEGGMDQIMVCLATSVAITRDLSEDVIALRQRLQMDSKIKENWRLNPQRMSDPTADSGLAYEEREHLMCEMDQKARFSAQNSVLQQYCLQCICHFAQGEANQKDLLDSYDWESFLSPLILPEEYQAMDCSIACAKACFTMLQCKTKLYRFMELQGVRYVLRALEYDDAEVKYLAAEALGILSNADKIAFQLAIEREGGVKTIMRLTESQHKKIRAQAFHAVAQLCNNKELGSMFVAQNILVSISSYSSKVKHQPQILTRLVQIVASLADNEKNRWKVLERGGATLLLKCIVHYDLEVARTAAGSLARLVADSESDLREAVTRNKMASNMALCIDQSPFPEVLRDTLRTLALVTEREAYREKAVPPGSESIVDGLLLLSDDDDREAKLRKRLLDNMGRKQDEIADFKKGMEQDADRYKQQHVEADGVDGDEDSYDEEAEESVDEDGETSSAAREGTGEDAPVPKKRRRKKNASLAAQEQDMEAEVAGMDRGRAGKDVCDALAANALHVVNQLLLIPRVLEHLCSSTVLLQRLLKAAITKGAPRRFAQAVRAICLCLALQSCHERAAEIGMVLHLSRLCKMRNLDAKVHVAECLRLLAANPAVRDYFAAEKPVAGMKALAGSKMREVQTSSSIALRDLSQTPEVAALLARAPIMSELLELLDIESDSLRLDVLQTVQQLCPAYANWFVAPEPGADEDLAVSELGPCIQRSIGVFRLAQLRSILGNTALHTLCQLLKVCPPRLCPLIDPTGVLDLKKTAQQRARETGKGVSYTGELGKSSCDLHAYIKTGGDVAGRLISAEPRVHAARALCCMTTQDGPTGGPRVSVLKALSVEDMLRQAANEANDSHDTRYLVLMLRMAANCAQRPTQRHKLAEDKSGLLKVLLDLTTHVSPYVVHAAFRCLAIVSEEPLSHHRLLALCPIEHLASALSCFIQDTLDVETLGTASKAPDLSKGLPRLFASLLYELSRFMANLSDGGPAAARSLKEAQEALTQAVAKLPGHLPRDVKLHVFATLGRLDGKEPQAVQGLQATFDSLVAAARDRLDAARVQKGVSALATLARDAENHREMVDAGAIDALLLATRNPMPDIFIRAVWALVFLLLAGERSGGEDVRRGGTTAKEREKQAEARCQRVAEFRAMMLADDGRMIAPILKASTDVSGQRLPPVARHVACKFLSLLLRGADGAEALEK